MEHPHGATMNAPFKAHIVAAPVELVPDYIARLEADVAAHKRAIATLNDNLARILMEFGE
jgi:hypothetical protein